MNSETMMTMPVAPTGYGNGGGFGFGGDGAWWIILFLIFGWGNNGFGNGGGGYSGEVQRGFDHQATISKLDGIQQGLCSLGYEVANQGCETRFAISNSTRDIIDNQNCNTRAILDFLTNDKIESLRTENQTLRFQASQAAQTANINLINEAQTAELIRRLGKDIPVPAYVVPNPNCCYGNGYGCGSVA